MSELASFVSNAEYDSYFSLGYFVILLPLAVLAYLVAPKAIRRVVLLVSSYAFFYAISGKLLIYLLISTLSVFLVGLWLGKMQKNCDAKLAVAEKAEKKGIKAASQRRQRLVLALGIIINIGMLVVLKYTAFFATNLNSLLGSFGSEFTVRVPSFMLPIGISFYSMQAASYLFDVYRKIAAPDKNLLRIAMYMSFFPQLMEGPICRYGDTASQLYDANPMKWENFTLGCQRILYGMVKKIVIADRLNMFITNVFAYPDRYNGEALALGAVCYTVQLYMDFSGTMDAVIGTGQIFGIKMPENFKRPFCSKSISEFWTRWHITLGTWFKDYIFYPLSMSKPLKKLTSAARKKMGNHFGPLCSGAIALFCVWLMNGLWHGDGWNYIFFGMYHFVLILCGNICEPYIVKLTEKLHIDRNGKKYTIFRIAKTTLLVCIGELFFRAETLSKGFYMIGHVFASGKRFPTGLDVMDVAIVILTLLGIAVIGHLQEKGVGIRESIAKRNVVVRFAVWYAVIMFIVIFGAYGVGYLPVDPIYAAF